MAFFCSQTGARIVAPGVHISVQPNGVPAFDGSEASIAAESAAVAVLSGHRRHDLECEPSPPAQQQARAAALKAFDNARKPEPAKEIKPAEEPVPASPRDEPTKPDAKPVAPSAKAEPESPKGGRHAREPKPDKP